MIMTSKSIRRTRNDRVAAGIRIGLGVLFVMSGAMKVVVPTLGAAFDGQLAAANIPFQDLNRWAVPFWSDSTLDSPPWSFSAS